MSHAVDQHAKKLLRLPAQTGSGLPYRDIGDPRHAVPWPRRCTPPQKGYGTGAFSAVGRMIGTPNDWFAGTTGRWRGCGASLNPPTTPVCTTNIEGQRSTLDMRPTKIPRTPQPPRDIFSSHGEPRTDPQKLCSDFVRGCYPFSPTREEKIHYPHQAKTALYATPRRLHTLAQLRDEADPMPSHLTDTAKLRARYRRSGNLLTGQLELCCQHAEAYKRAEGGGPMALLKTARMQREGAERFQLAMGANTSRK